MAELTKEQVEDLLMLVAENRDTARSQHAILASWDSLRLRAEEAERKSKIDEAQCDEMTERAAKLAGRLEAATKERDDRARMLESSNKERRRIVGIFQEAIGAVILNGLDVSKILGPELEEQVHGIVELEQPAKGETREELRAARDAAKLAAGKVRGVLREVLNAKTSKHEPAIDGHCIETVVPVIERLSWNLRDRAEAALKENDDG